MLLPLPQGPRSKKHWGRCCFYRMQQMQKMLLLFSCLLLSSCISVYLGFERWFQGLLGSPGG